MSCLAGFSHDLWPSLAGGEADLSVVLCKNRHHRKNGHNRRHLLNIFVVNGRKQDFLHFGIHLVVFLLKSFPDASNYSVKSFVVNLFIFIPWIFMRMVWFTVATSESWWHFPLSWHLGVIDIKIDFGELNSFPKELKTFIRSVWH